MYSASNIPSLCKNFPQRLEDDMTTGECFHVYETVQDLSFFLLSSFLPITIDLFHCHLLYGVRASTLFPPAVPRSRYFV